MQKVGESRCRDMLLHFPIIYICIYIYVYVYIYIYIYILMLMTLTHSLFPAWAKWISWRSSTGNHQIIGRTPPYFFFPKRTTSEFFLVHSSLPKHGFFRQVERVADAMGCGQVLDVESGENQTLGADFTEEVLLQRFPKLQAGDG